MVSGDQRGETVRAFAGKRNCQCIGEFPHIFLLNEENPFPYDSLPAH